MPSPSARASAPQEDDQENTGKHLFFTTSDLVESLNTQLSRLQEPTDGGPQFELQKRLPNGSTYRATPQDIAAADMESKFQQAAHQLSLFQTTSEKQEWAQRQRREGNRLYEAGNYKEAMDVYLTCLVAKPNDEKSGSWFTTEVFWPVLNNLAQCAMQLGMYSKAEQFCAMALEESYESRKDSSTTTAKRQIQKLYFRRGKARRRKGEYTLAEEDLQQALELLQDDTDNAEEKRRTVQQELDRVHRSQVEAARNERRQARAMQKLLGGSGIGTASLEHDTTTRSTTMWSSSHSTTTTRTSRAALYPEESTPRYSKLRSRKQMKRNQPEEKEEDTITYREWYWRMVARVATKLLEWIGDEEEAQADNDHEKYD